MQNHIFDEQASEIIKLKKGSKDNLTLKMH